MREHAHRGLLLALALATGMGGAVEAGGDDASLVVHEWGTFTSVAGADGLPVAWRPLGGESDLPRFVHEVVRETQARAWPASRRPPGTKAQMKALVRMETPVDYFYSDRPLTASVSVTFPEGWITEWYPKARSVGAGIAWGPVDVRPGAADALPVDAEPSPYYEARETDAAPLRVAGATGPEHEKFLFYRGVGNLEPPLFVRLEARRLVVRRPARGIAQVIVFESREGKVGFGVHRLERAQTIVPRPPLDATVGAASSALQDLLLAQGLYPREAEAMLDTWRASWFEDGLRAFYIVPRALTDAVLPLSLSPRPAQLVRVLVARTEIVTPEMEEAFRREIATLGAAAEDVHAAAAALVRDRGRFAEPILRRLRARSKDEALQHRIDALIAAMESAPPGPVASR
jgi:hypothetical protein